MTQRPRSHCLEDESRRRFLNAIPIEWTAQDISRDYGLDLRVDVFSRDGRATGLGFYVQLKATDKPDSRENRRIRVKATHYQYWNSLSDPVLLARYFAQTGHIYVRWAHRFHPDFRPEFVRQESQSVKLSSSMRLRAHDFDWMVTEIKNLSTVAHGAVHFPLRVGVSGLEDDPLRGDSLTAWVSAAKAAASRTHVRWTAGDDRTDMLHVYVGATQVQARAGKVIFSFRALDSPGKLDEELDRNMWIQAALCALGLAVGLAGGPAVGMELLATYGKTLPLLPAVFADYVAVLIWRSQAFDHAMSLMETWASGSRRAEEASISTFMHLRSGMWGQLSNAQRRRLDEYRASQISPFLDDSTIRKLDIDFAIRLGRTGFHGEALHVLEPIFSDIEVLRSYDRDAVIEASRWALTSDEPDLAEQWLRAVIDDDAVQGAEFLLLVRTIYGAGPVLRRVDDARDESLPAGGEGTSAAAWAYPVHRFASLRPP